VVYRGDKRHGANALGGYAEQQVDHRAVPNHRRLDDVCRCDRRLGLDPLTGQCDQIIDGFEHQAAQLFSATVLAGIDDSRDHVFAPGNLLVILGDLGANCAGYQVDQPHGDRRRTDIDCHAPNGRVICFRNWMDID
jgi:hypothetical protein